MREKPWFAVVYMFCVTAFFSFIVIAFAQLTRERVEANRQLAFEKAVLEAFYLAEGKSSVELHEAFLERIRAADDRTYELVDNGKAVAIAVPIEGKGFWAPIKGVVAVTADRKGIVGIAFHEQSETPGLGAEITKPAFRDRFKGLQVGPAEKPIGIKPFGSELSQNEVEAISGATQTCTRLETLINEGLGKWLGAAERGDGR